MVGNNSRSESNLRGLCSYRAVRVWFDYIVAYRSELNDKL